MPFEKKDASNVSMECRHVSMETWPPCETLRFCVDFADLKNKPVNAYFLNLPRLQKKATVTVGMSSDTMVRTLGVALCMAVAVLLLAADVPASTAPAHSPLKLPPAPSVAAAALRKVQATVDWLKGIAGRETRSDKENCLRAEKAARGAEEATRLAAAEAEDRSRKTASLKAEMTVVVLLLAVISIANAGHFLHANASTLAFVAKTLYANPGPTSSLIIFLAKAWWAGSSTRQVLVSSPLVTFICNAGQLLHDAVSALGNAYSEAYRHEKEEATSAALPVDEAFCSPAKTSTPTWHFTSSPEWHYTCSPVRDRQPSPAPAMPEGAAMANAPPMEDAPAAAATLESPLAAPDPPSPQAVALVAARASGLRGDFVYSSQTSTFDWEPEEFRSPAKTSKPFLAATPVGTPGKAVGGTPVNPQPSTLQGYLAHIISPPLGPCSRAMLRALRWS